MSTVPFAFEIIHQSKKSRARVGRIYTTHGSIDTPNFVGVGTNAALKAVDTSMADELDLQLLFCNTYHLMLHPGQDIVKNAGGLHNFMNRSKPLITDSGGFQVFSLAYGTVEHELKSSGQKKGNSAVLKVSEEGVLFRSYRDGAPLLLTPESSVLAQKDLGADIIIPFDELPPYHIDAKALEASLHRTHRWEKRSLDEHRKNPKHQAMYAVVHGGVDPRLRKISCEYLTAQPFDGFAIGGSLGKTRDQLFDLLDFVMPLLPENKPNHLLGIGDLTSVEASIAKGVDTFDSSFPTRNARHGLLLSKNGNIKILQGRYKQAFEPIEEGCICFTCRQYTKAYVHHLFKTNELSAYTLSSIHNLHYMVQLMVRYREQILQGRI
jgi:queuine tRNA-ribosyltransferase